MSSSELSNASLFDAPPPNASLTELQNWMVKLIRHNRALHKNPQLSETAKAHFQGNERLSPAEQINIYRVQFWLRHTNILVEHFPGLTRLLGQKAWEPIAESYLARPELDVLALGDLGKDMAAHLASLPTFSSQQLCVEMAHLEWAYQEAFSAADEPSLSLEKLSQMPESSWAGARFVLADSVHLLQVQYPVADLRRQLRTDALGPSDVDNIKKQPQNLVVYRRDGSLWDKALSTPAFLLLQQFQAGVPLIPACEQVVSESAQAASVFDEELGQWFSLWGRLGWIIDVIPGEA